MKNINKQNSASPLEIEGITPPSGGGGTLGIEGALSDCEILTHTAIIDAVCQALEVTPAELKNGTQARHIADARALLSYFLCKHTDLTQVRIIALMDLKNHTSVIGHLKKVNDLLSVNRHFADKKTRVENLIKHLCA